MSYVILLKIEQKLEKEQSQKLYILFSVNCRRRKKTVIELILTKKGHERKKKSKLENKEHILHLRNT